MWMWETPCWGDSQRPQGARRRTESLYVHGWKILMFKEHRCHVRMFFFLWVAIAMLNCLWIVFVCFCSLSSCNFENNKKCWCFKRTNMGFLRPRIRAGAKFDGPHLGNHSGYSKLFDVIWALDDRWWSLMIADQVAQNGQFLKFMTTLVGHWREEQRILEQMQFLRKFKSVQNW